MELIWVQIKNYKLKSRISLIFRYEKFICNYYNYDGKLEKMHNIDYYKFWKQILTINYINYDNWINNKTIYNTIYKNINVNNFNDIFNQTI